MNISDVQILIRQGEGLRVEFKEAKDSIPSSIYETVVSFSNTEGGTILLGINNQGDIEGINPVPSGSHGKDWKSILIYLVPTWNQKGTNLEALDWPKKQPLSREEIEKVPRWEEKSTNLVHKKIRIIISILCLVSDSISLDDLMTSMDYQNRKTFRDNYLKPLEMVQFIVKTNPDKPNNPDQKYKITEKGKSFLGGIGN